MSRYLAILCIILCTVPVRAVDGSLQSLRHVVDRPSEDKDDKDDKKDKKETDCENFDPFGYSSSDGDRSSASGGDGSGDGLIAAMFFAPFVLPALAMNDDYGRDGFFPDYPYQQDRPGYMRFPVVEGDEPEPLRTIAGSLTVEYGSDFKDVERYGQRLLLDTSPRFGIQAGHDWFREELDGGTTDEVNFGTVNLTFRFAQSRRALMYTGLGVNILDAGTKTDYGFNFLYGADVFPVKPVMLSLQMDAGTLGDANLFRARGTVGINWRRFEAFIGYDYLNVGGVELQGMMAGLRLWW
jgi:hypothetical protein